MNLWIREISKPVLDPKKPLDPQPWLDYLFLASVVENVEVTGSWAAGASRLDLQYQVFDIILQF